MVSTPLIGSQTATDAELAAAAQQAAESIDRTQIKEGEEAAEARSIPGTLKPLSYTISESDKGSWVMVWELRKDAAGNEYGIPRRAPRQQLGLWLSKTREADGGKRFTHEQPTRIAAEPQYHCTIREDCHKGVYTRIDLVEHIRNCHDREARIYHKILDEMVEKAATDNPGVAELLKLAASTMEAGVRSVELTPTQPVYRQEKLDLEAGKPTVKSVGGVPDQETGCASCDWLYKEEWSTRQRTQFLTAHIRTAHKEEL